MAKVMLKKAGVAAAQSLLRELWPELDKRLDGVDKKLQLLADDVHRTDAKIDVLDERMRDGFERHLALINEVNAKLIPLDGSMEGFMEAVRILQPVRPAQRKRVG